MRTVAEAELGEIAPLLDVLDAQHSSAHGHDGEPPGGPTVVTVPLLPSDVHDRETLDAVGAHLFTR